MAKKQFEEGWGKHEIQIQTRASGNPTKHKPSGHRPLWRQMKSATSGDRWPCKSQDASHSWHALSYKITSTIPFPVNCITPKTLSVTISLTSDRRICLCDINNVIGDERAVAKASSCPRYDKGMRSYARADATCWHVQCCWEIGPWSHNKFQHDPPSRFRDMENVCALHCNRVSRFSRVSLLPVLSYVRMNWNNRHVSVAWCISMAWKFSREWKKLPKKRRAWVVWAWEAKGVSKTVSLVCSL